MWQKALPSFYFYCYLLRLPSMLRNVFSIQESEWFLIKVKSCHKEIRNPLSTPRFTQNEIQSPQRSTGPPWPGRPSLLCCPHCYPFPPSSGRTDLLPFSDSPGSLLLWPWLLASTLPGMVFPFGFARLTSSSPSSIVQTSASQWGLSTLLPLLNLATVLFLFFSAFVGFACVCMHAQSCPTLCDPWIVACQPPLFTEFPRKNTGVGCHFLLQGIVPAQGWNSGLLHLLQWQADSLPPSHRPSHRLYQLLIHFTIYMFNVFTLHWLSYDESKPSQGKKKRCTDASQLLRASFGTK